MECTSFSCPSLMMKTTTIRFSSCECKGMYRSTIKKNDETRNRHAHFSIGMRLVCVVLCCARYFRIVPSDILLLSMALWIEYNHELL